MFRYLLHKIIKFIEIYFSLLNISLQLINFISEIEICPWNISFVMIMLLLLLNIPANYSFLTKILELFHKIKLPY